MKTLFVQYTLLQTHISLAIEQEIVQTVVCSSKELSKYFIPHIQNILKLHTISIHDLNALCVNTGPAPAFTQRSLLAACNGIATAIRLLNKQINLFSIDDFELLHMFYQEKNPNYLVIALCNAYAHDVFFFYKQDDTTQSGLMTLADCNNLILSLQGQKQIKIIGEITKVQEDFLNQNNITIENSAQLPHHSYCTASQEYIKCHSPVDYLFPRYIKFHTVETKLKNSLDNACLNPSL